MRSGRENNDGLYRIELTTPISSTLVGTVRLGSVFGPELDLSGGDIAPDASGGWYLWTNSTNDLYALGVTTAVATQLEPSTSAPKTGLAVELRGPRRRVHAEAEPGGVHDAGRRRRGHRRADGHPVAETWASGVVDRDSRLECLP